MQAQPAVSEPHRLVWDLPVRIFHWTLVAAVAGAWLTHELGIEYFGYHVWCGYAVLVLVAFRMVWAFVGTRHARIQSFLRSPRVVTRYAADLLRGLERQYVGHNPLGGWMVLLLLLLLLAQAVLGLFGNDEIYNLGPLNGYVSSDRGIALTSLHRNLFYVILGLIALHVVAVAYHRFARREDLVQSLVTGRKPAAIVPEDQQIQSSRVWMALLIVAGLVAILAWVVLHAPASQAFDSFN